MQSVLFVVNRSKGWSLRRIVDLSCYYYLATDELNCKRCNRAFHLWDNLLVPTNTSVAITVLILILNQLSELYLQQFPAVLAYKLGCNRNVFALLRGRTLGNSPTALSNAILELLTDEWPCNQLCYLDECRRYVYRLVECDEVCGSCLSSYSDGQTRLLKCAAPEFEAVPKMDTVPSDWYAPEAAVYCGDVPRHAL